MRASDIAPETLQRIAQAVESLRYGTVQITVHNARVVQIDKVERIRLTPSADLTAGSDPTAAPIDRTSGDSRQHQALTGRERGRADGV